MFGSDTFPLKWYDTPVQPKAKKEPIVKSQYGVYMNSGVHHNYVLWETRSFIFNTSYENNIIKCFVYLWKQLRVQSVNLGQPGPDTIAHR